MFKDDSDKLPDNRLFYKYIQLAYEYINRVADDSVRGDRMVVLNRLYHQRFSSIFDDLNPYNEQIDSDFQQIREWFKDERAKKVSQIIVGHIDEFHVGKDDAQTFDVARPDYVSEFKKDADKGGRLNDLGLDAYASYLPIHFFFSGNRLATEWGIYLSEQSIMRLAAALRQACEQELGTPQSESESLFVQAAYQILLRHEMEHFKIESFALNAEMFLKRPIYSPYLTNVYATTYGTDDCLEEALANATILNSTVIQQVFNELYPPKCYGWRYVLIDHFFYCQPRGYRNFDLRSGWPQETGPYSTEAVGYQESILTGKTSRFNPRRLAMNYLCNQIVMGEVRPKSADVPFFAFLPDNHFLRAENLVPIHLVKSLGDDESFIRLATPSRKQWEAFLRELGYQPTSRGKGDHEVWRSVFANLPDQTINYHGKELDFHSYKSTLKNLGIRISDYDSFRQSGKLPHIIFERLASAAPIQ